LALCCGTVSPITLRVALAAVFAYASIYHGLLYRGRAREQEHLWFAIVSTGFGVLALSNAMILGADTRTLAMLATQIGGAAAIVIMGGFYEYSSVVLGLDPRQMRPRLAWYVAGLVLVAFGAFVSATPLPRLVDLAGPPAPYPRVYITVPGQLYFTLTLALALHGVTRLVRAARTHPELVRVVVAWCATWLVASHDMATRLMGVRSFMLTELLGVATIGAMTAAVLDRFASAESTLQHRTEELHRSHSELQGIQEQLVQRQQLAAVGELSAVIAHEVRNPIAVIKNAVSGLRRERTRDEDRLTLLGILDEETDRLNRLMHDLLAYARPVVPQSEPVDLVALLERAVERACAAVDADTRFDVTMDVHPQAATVQGDPKLLLQALASLVENAAQAMPDGGTLRLETRTATLRGQSAVEVHVVDSGHGMDTEVAVRAKEPFFTTRPRGTGLGLAIVERVAANHGGQLRIHSEVGNGTRVTLVLPAERVSAIPLPPGEGRRSSPGEAPA
jgi:signal transduction histidine kinase